MHNWRSFKEDQVLPEVNTALPEFNQVLVDSGLVYRTTSLDSDWFIQDSLVYGSSSAPLRYYIAPGASYELGDGANFIAFDSLYTARFRRVSNTKAVLSLDYINDPSDQRPNDLLTQEDHPNYSIWGFHVKDYHVYLWALMEQIDRKLDGCSMTTNVENQFFEQEPFLIYPNPNNGVFKILPNFRYPSTAGDEIRIVDVLGRSVKTFSLNADEIDIEITVKGVYWVISRNGNQKIVVH